MLISGNITIDKIKNLSIDDINKLTKAEMEEYIKAGARRMKDRAQRAQEAIERRGVDAPSRYDETIRYANKMQEYIDRPKANLNVMRKYIRDIQSNLSNKTSTFAGYEKSVNKFVGRVIGERKGLKNRSYKSTYDTLFRAYSRITEKYPVINNSSTRSSEAIQMEILNYMEDMTRRGKPISVDEIVEHFFKEYGDGSDEIEINPFEQLISSEEDDEE